MLLNRFPVFFSRRDKDTASNYRSTMYAASILLSFFLLSAAAAERVPDKYYLRLEQNRTSDTDDLKITSIGVLALKDNMAGHVDLTRLDSTINGKALALDFGGGYAFNWDVSLYFSFGVSLGYNLDTNDYIAAYFPEVGVVVDITKTFGITASGKRYHNLYDNDENIIMLGLVFRS